MLTKNEIFGLAMIINSLHAVVHFFSRFTKWIPIRKSVG